MELKSLSKSKKGQLGALAPAIMTLVFAAILLTIGLVINQEIRDTTVDGSAGCNSTDVSSCGAAYDAANTTLAGLGTFADFWTIIVLAIVAVVVIGVLLAVFGSGKTSR